MNEGRTSKNDAKRRKGTKNCNENQKVATKIQPESRRNQRKQLTQDMQPCTVGIYHLGRVSIPMNRGVRISEKIARQKAGKDMKKILALANAKPSVEFPRLESEETVTKASSDSRQQDIFSTPTSRKSSIISTSSRSADVSSLISTDTVTNMQSPIGDEAPLLISQFHRCKLQEMFPEENILEDILKDLRRNYSSIRKDISQSIVPSHVPAMAHVQDNIKCQSGDSAKNIYLQDSLGNNKSSINSVFSVSPLKQQEIFHCFGNDVQPEPNTVKNELTNVNVCWKYESQNPHTLPAKVAYPEYYPNPTDNYMDYDKDEFLLETPYQVETRLRNSSPIFISTGKSTSPMYFDDDIFFNLSSDTSPCVKICSDAPHKWATNDSPPSPRFYRYKLC